jgi:hypothetical protein
MAFSVTGKKNLQDESTRKVVFHNQCFHITPRSTGTTIQAIRPKLRKASPGCGRKAAPGISIGSFPPFL